MEKLITKNTSERFNAIPYIVIMDLKQFYSLNNLRKYGSIADKLSEHETTVSDFL